MYKSGHLLKIFLSGSCQIVDLGADLLPFEFRYFLLLVASGKEINIT